jgi:hypothetical protein
MEVCDLIKKCTGTTQGQYLVNTVSIGVKKKKILIRGNLDE